MRKARAWSAEKQVSILAAERCCSMLVQHVSHQRVMRLCATQPDAALSVRFLKLVQKPSLTLLNTVMAVCSQKGDVDREYPTLISLMSPFKCTHL